MGKVKSSKLKEIAKQFKDDGILSDGSVLRCDTCHCHIAVDEKHLISRVQQHLAQQKHKKKQNLENNFGKAMFHSWCFKKCRTEGI